MMFVECALWWNGGMDRMEWMQLNELNERDGMNGTEWWDCL